MINRPTPTLRSSPYLKKHIKTKLSEYTLYLWIYGTRTGFAHYAELISVDSPTDVLGSAKVNYQNRAWEAYDGQKVFIAAVRDSVLPQEEITALVNILSNPGLMESKEITDNALVEATSAKPERIDVQTRHNGWEVWIRDGYGNVLSYINEFSADFVLDTIEEAMAKIGHNLYDFDLNSIEFNIDGYRNISLSEFVEITEREQNSEFLEEELDDEDYIVQRNPNAEYNELNYDEEDDIDEFYDEYAESTKASKKALAEAVSGWIAILDGKKVEIRKGEADSLYAAKKLAIKKFYEIFGKRMSKAKESLISIEPAYNDDELEDAPASNAQFEKTQEESKKALTEGTGNFSMSDAGFPTYIFYPYEDFLNNMGDDNYDYATEKGLDYSSLTDEEIDALTEERLKELQETYGPVLEVSEVEYAIDELNKKFKYDIIDDYIDAHELGRYDIDIPYVSLKSGYYSGASVVIRNTEDLEKYPDLKQTVLDLLEKYLGNGENPDLDNGYGLGLSKIKVAYRFSNGETGYTKVESVEPMKIDDKPLAEIKRLRDGFMLNMYNRTIDDVPYSSKSYEGKEEEVLLDIYRDVMDAFFDSPLLFGYKGEFYTKEMFIDMIRNLKVTSKAESTIQEKLRWTQKVVLKTKNGKIIKYINNNPEKNDSVDYYVLVDKDENFIDRNVNFDVLKKKLKESVITESINDPWVTIKYDAASGHFRVKLFENDEPSSELLYEATSAEDYEAITDIAYDLYEKYDQYDDFLISFNKNWYSIKGFIEYAISISPEAQERKDELPEDYYVKYLVRASSLKPGDHLSDTENGDQIIEVKNVGSEVIVTISGFDGDFERSFHKEQQVTVYMINPKYMAEYSVKNGWGDGQHWYEAEKELAARAVRKM